MELSGEVQLPAAPARIRAALGDAEVMGRLLPASRGLRPVGTGVFEGALVLGTPPFAHKQQTRVTVQQEPDGFTVRAVGTERGRGEPPFVEAHCRWRPLPSQGATHVQYRLTAELGPLANLIGAGSVQRLIGEFFRALEAELAPR